MKTTIAQTGPISEQDFDPSETRPTQRPNRYAAALDEWEAAGRKRNLEETRIEGKWIWSGKRKFVNLSSNDYLGVAVDTALRSRFYREAAGGAYPLSAASSRLLTGNHAAYTDLENELSEMFETEAALVFNSGYHMNSGILPCIAGSETLILADKLVHASLIDGIRLASARCIRYRHRDYGQLEFLIEKHRKEYREILLVTESVFSMDGDTADLPLLASFKHRYGNIRLYVDEAHAFGLRGKNGLGLAEEQGCMAEVDFLCGTFGKAAGSLGAYVVCRKMLRDYLVNRMRPLIYTTALPPVNVYWTRFVLSHIREWTQKRKQLKDWSERIRRVLREKGMSCLSDSQIIPIPMGTCQRAVDIAAKWREAGFYVLPIRPPTVPEGGARLRISLSSALEESDVVRLIRVLEDSV